MVDTIVILVISLLQQLYFYYLPFNFNLRVFLDSFLNCLYKLIFISALVILVHKLR